MVKKLKMFIPFLCCFVILVSFVVPASAASEFVLQGSWDFLSVPLLSSDFDFPYSFTISGTDEVYDGFVYDSNAGDLYAYNQAADYFFMAGGEWNGQIPTITLTGAHIVSESFWRSLRDILVYSTSYTLFFNLNGGYLPNGQVPPSPPGRPYDEYLVNLVPIRDGYTFVGWQFDGIGSYAGSVFTYGYGNGMLTAQWLASGSTDPSDPTNPSDPTDPPDPDARYSLTINIFNSSGTTLYQTFSATSLTAVSPTATLYPIAVGLSVDVGTGARWTWLDAEDGFIGFSNRPFSSTAIYAAGGTYFIGGEEQDTILNLYVVYQDAPASPVGVDFVSWLGDAVGGFLDFELWPGLSLNDLLWVVLVIGVLFAFLKMTV